MSNNTTDFLGNGNASRPGFKSNIITSIDAEPTIVRLCRNPVIKQEAVEVFYFEYKLGKNTYTRPCRNSLGVGPNPTLEKYKELLKIRDELKSAGKADTETYKENEALLKLFKPKKKYYLFGFEPGETTLKAIKVSPLIIDQIWGYKGNQYKKAVPSLKDTIAKKGIPIFMVGDKDKNDIGWVKMWRTGEKLGTSYHISLHTKTVQKEVDGMIIDVPVPVKIEIPDSLYETGIDTSNVPDVVEFEKKYAWSLEEEQLFVKNLGQFVPQRIKDDMANKDNENSENVSEMDPIDLDPKKSAPETASLDEVPF